MNPNQHRSYEVAAIAKCKLCNVQFTGPTAQRIGETPPARLARFCQKLAEHIMTKHTEHNQALELKALEFLGMLRMLNYQTSDPELRGQMDYLRWSTHQMTLAARLPDKAIKEKSDELAGLIVKEVYLEHQTDASLREKISNLLAEQIAGLRDILEEPGRYSVSPMVSADGSEIPAKAAS